MKNKLQSIILSICFWSAWVLFVPYLFEVAYSDFIRESELNSRLGWYVAITALVWLTRRRWVGFLLLLPFVITGMADIFYAYFFGGVFSTSTMDAIFNTDVGEASELFTAYLHWDSLLIALVYLGGFIVLGIKAQLPQRLTRVHKVVTGLGVLVLAFALQQMVVQHRFYDIVPGLLGIMPTYAINAENFDKAVAEYRALAQRDTTPVALKHPEKRHTYVIVIGEAMTRSHMSLYGYPRATTPQLDARKAQLTIFRDVAAPFVQTRPALMADLFPQGWEHPERNYQHALAIANQARRAGYKVFWLSNQQPFRIPTQLIADTVDHPAFMTRKVAGVAAHRYDGLLLEDVVQALEDPAPNKLIFVHLMGSHLQYANRYPPEFDRFKDTPPQLVSPDLLPWEIRKVNEYDNSILYTDWVVTRMLDQLQQRVEPDTLAGWMLFSDHGEEVYETARLNGHTPDNPTLPMFTIPVLFWHSDGLKQALSDVVRGLAQNHDRPYLADRLYETWWRWLDLQGACVDDCRFAFDRPWQPRKRMAYGFDIDARFNQK
ncbi:heptose-I-phosphate ethanolaminephosphotransferase [Sulfurivirga caldicuralii]|uniref:Heptose-I-phosphate ethanolaminephosphotransferase n=1 Tax=Sulfurivirga caldicuralii TaxID=364032 RepID=A0A1N6F3B3_9GAMM|nr:phosphoethanolamine transferase [Sulfurivirga caldicuralii]SIN89737.1 heptose-I-phosphate ethanolaminephosphotransferase [Sulfurivirga caldicuralii]